MQHCKQTLQKRFLECFGVNVLVQVLDWPDRKSALLILLLVNNGQGMIACGCIDCRDPEMVVEDSEKSEEGNGRIKTLDFRKGDSSLLKEPVDGISLWTALKSKGAKMLTDLQEQPSQRSHLNAFFKLAMATILFLELLEKAKA